jgi:hypothetical protein
MRWSRKAQGLPEVFLLPTRKEGLHMAEPATGLSP